MKRSNRNIPHRTGQQRPANLIETTYAQVVALYQNNQLTEALELCRSKLLKLAPNHAGGLLYAGVICYLSNDFPTAEKYLKAATRAGNSPDAYTNLALTLAAMHRLPEAESAYRRAVALNPQADRAWNNLGNILKNSFQAERRNEALECYRRAIAANPRYANAYNNLGHALDSISGDKAGAEENFRAAIAHNPKLLQAHLNLADILDRTGRVHEALECLRAALALQPGNFQVTGRILGLRRSLADWDDAQKPSMSDFLAARPTSDTSEFQPLNLLAWPEIDAATQRELAGKFGRTRWAASLAAEPLVSSVAQPHTGRLRIGYLSADFRNHPVAHLVTQVIAAHDRERFEAHLYAYGPEIDDEERRQLIQAADHFTVISRMDDLEAAKLIRDDQIDILVDLTGYTTHARPGICALRPAPVIASWIGYIGTLGETRLADYIIGDAVVTPPEHAEQFSEALALMPECFQPNCPMTPLAAPPPRSAEGLPDDAIVFCSFNQVFKFTPQLWDDWCEILRNVPKGVLWIAPGSSEVIRNNLLKETRKRGVAPERIVFADRKSLAEHRSRVALADIALDTYPYNSGATASDTLRAGVPLITCMGETFVSRMAGSLLHALGLDELSTRHRADYVQLAIRLANDAPKREELRRTLGERLATSTLYRPEVFAPQLEALFSAMHEQALSGQRGTIDLSRRITAC
ncbi:tetratricopeptide repeat protein [Pseudomonas sp. PDM20]|uniref:O-linked N-acetylglucosamine transferase, SPINDLY family protein n=1 Tax=Pseudomonas sp. PDM20 TaxID=2769254 RepID=UPI00177E966C|nr:glycosyltransferase family 41 protein [Pseudomonas sp. PDM20]MBD9683128.1 tetratricopeptide repeat protein [Pseudomonas sp. PDM20]